MEGSFLSPAVDDTLSHPAWVLLEKNSYRNYYGKTCFDDGDDATTAHSVTSGGRTVKVTFRLVSPPAVSRFCFRDDTEHSFDLDPLEAVVISSAKDLVLFRPRTLKQPKLYEYLIYQAACNRGNSHLPTLKLIPANHPSMSYPAIFPCDDDDGEFLIADLSETPDRGRYLLDVFSSKTNKWVTWPLLWQPRCSVPKELSPHKVMALGGGAVAWINLWEGILLCNVLDEQPVLRFIPLPTTGIDLRQMHDPQRVRDVTCCDGIFKFLEIDRRFKQVSLTDGNANKTMYDDLDAEGIIYDSEPFDHSRRMQYTTIPDGWRIRTCYRHISWDYWRKGHVVDSDDIEIDHPRYSLVLSQPRDYSTQRSVLKNLAMGCCPSLSPCGDDVAYLWSEGYIYKQDGWMVRVHLGKKTVEAVENIDVSHFNPPLLPCAFSNI